MCATSWRCHASRASFALMLALLPATATVVGVIVLRQIPSLRDTLGVALVMAGVGIHRPAAPSRSSSPADPRREALSLSDSA
jgi:inner membrane transporter RhtA